MSLGMAAYRLYWYRTASSLAPMATLEEVGADYEAVEVDCAAGAHREPAYRQIHPLGLVPALRLPDGRTVFESAGIVMFLADRHPEAGLAPDARTEERAFYSQCFSTSLTHSTQPTTGSTGLSASRLTRPTPAGSRSAAGRS